MKLLSLFVLSFSVFGATLEVRPSTHVQDGVTLGESADLTTDSGEVIHLESVGNGTRLKKVGVLNVKVYVAQLFVSNLPNLDHSHAGVLNSLESMKASALRLTFVRSVTSDQLTESFMSALTANNIDTNRDDIKSFLKVFEGDQISAADFFDFVILDKNTVQVNLNLAKNRVVSSVTVTVPVKDILSMWFGMPADQGIDNLRQQILGQK